MVSRMAEPGAQAHVFLKLETLLHGIPPTGGPWGAFRGHRHQVLAGSEDRPGSPRQGASWIPSTAAPCPQGPRADEGLCHLLNTIYAATAKGAVGSTPQVSDRLQVGAPQAPGPALSPAECWPPGQALASEALGNPLPSTPQGLPHPQSRRGGLCNWPPPAPATWAMSSRALPAPPHR